MAISTEQKVDYLWKKLGYGKSKTDVSSVKDAVNESIASPLLLRGEGVWTQSSLIPTAIPDSSSSIVTVYPTSSPVECTVDTTSSSNRTWKTNIIDWVPAEFGSTYFVKVYVHTSNAGAAASTSGNQVFAAGSGNNDEWFFDYQSGVLNFIGTNLPNGISFTGKSVYISGAVYAGSKGAISAGAATTFSSLNVSGVGTVTTLNSTTGTFTNLTTTNLNTTGVGTVTTLNSTTANLNYISGVNLSYSGIGTIATLNSTTGTVTNLTNTNLNTTGVGTIATLNSTTGTVTNLTNTNLNTTGVGTIATLNSTTGTVTNLTNTNLNVSGVSTHQNLIVNNDFDVYATDATFHNNLNVFGNVNIGGTTVVFTSQELRIRDKDVVIGIATNGNGEDISTDDTANHGGIAVASTEGSPLVSLNVSGINTLPNTYKQIMWVKHNTMGAGTTDAWLFNYAVGIGSTLVPNNVRLAVGDVQISDNNITSSNATISNLSGDTVDYTTGLVDYVSGINLSYTGIGTVSTLNSVDARLSNINSSGISTLGVTSATRFTAQSINSSGIVTGSTFRPSTGYIQAADGTNALYIYNSTGNIAFQGTIGASQINNASGFKVIGFAGTDITFENNAYVAGITTSIGGFVGSLTGTASTASFATTAYNLTDAANITTGTINANRLTGTYNIDISGNSNTSYYATSAGIATYATSAGIATYATDAGIATYATSAGIATYATSAGIATYATSAGIATYATDAGISTSVIGGIASVTQLNVTGISTFADLTDNTLGNENTGSVQIDGGLGIAKNLTVKENLYVGGYSEFVGVVTFKGGTINLGDANTDDIVIAGEFKSNLIPTDDATYNLGNGSQRWNNASFAGIVTATTFSGNASSADQVKTVTASDTNATYHLTFVDSHNGSATNETVYTDDGIYYNPGTNTFTTQHALFTGNVEVQGTLTGTATTSTRAITVDTIQTSTNASHYLTFVNSDNATASAETLYTDAGISYNPSTDTLTVSNLNVNGTTTQVNTTSITVEDSLIELAKVDGSAPSSDADKDVGLLLHYYDTAARLGAVYWDDSTNRMVLASRVTESSGVLTVDSGYYADVEFKGLYITDTAGSAEAVISYTTVDGVAGRYLQNITVDGGTF